MDKKQLLKKDELSRWNLEDFDFMKNPIDGKSQENHIFIGGCGRSGTTLLRVILDSHSKLSSGPESYLGLPLEVNFSYLSKQFDLPQDEIKSAYKVAQTRAEFIDMFSKMCLKKQKKEIWIDKTARNIHVAEKLLQTFPKAKFIYLLRDGRDIITSLKTHKKRWVNPETKKLEDTGFIMPLDLCIKRYNQSIKDTMKIKGNDRALGVHYEHLIFNTRDEVIKICKFLEITFEEKMLEFHKVKTQYRNAEKRFPQNIEATYPINSNQVSRWRFDLSAEDQLTIHKSINKQLRISNYDAGEKILIYGAAEISEIFMKYPQIAKESLIESLKIHKTKKFIQPPKTYLQRSTNAHTSDRTIAMPVHSEFPPLQGLKWIGSHPENTKRGLLRANAIIILNDPLTNSPFAILDGSEISARRTTAISELIIDKFAKPESKVLVIGSGNLGFMHLEKLSIFSEKVSELMIFSKRNIDLNDRVQKFKNTKQINDLAYGLNLADIVISLTNSETPYINASMLPAKSQILINLSLMDFSKNCYDNATSIIVDDLIQCSKAKKVYKDWLNSNTYDPSKIKELSSLFEYGKISDGKTIFNLLGMSIEDITLAQAVFKRLPKSLFQNHLKMKI